MMRKIIGHAVWTILVCGTVIVVMILYEYFTEPRLPDYSIKESISESAVVGEDMYCRDVKRPAWVIQVVDSTGKLVYQWNEPLISINDSIRAQRLWEAKWLIAELRRFKTH